VDGFGGIGHSKEKTPEQTLKTEYPKLGFLSPTREIDQEVRADRLRTAAQRSGAEEERRAEKIPGECRGFGRGLGFEGELSGEGFDVGWRENVSFEGGFTGDGALMRKPPCEKVSVKAKKKKGTDQCKAPFACRFVLLWVNPA
jgi:hypothetical protein